MSLSLPLLPLLLVALNLACAATLLGRLHAVASRTAHLRLTPARSAEAWAADGATVRRQCSPRRGTMPAPLHLQAVELPAPRRMSGRFASLELLAS
jgi:hypothetical protein